MTRWWHGATALLGLFALVGQTVLTVERGNSVVNLSSYFTIESNMLVVATSALLAIRPDRSGRVFAMVRLAALTGITVTGVVYATVLADNASFTGMEWWYDKIFHYVIPVMSVVGFLALRPRPRLTWAALTGLVFPIVWLGYTLVRAEIARPVFTLTPTTSARVPYGFLDVDELGASAVGAVCAALLAAFVALGCVYVWLSAPRD